MSKDLIGYDGLVDSALRSVVRRALASAAEHGLRGSHHFYVSFRTGFPGVVMPDFLRERYPDEMTIVLQHQFWALEAGDDAFSVTLSFNKAPQNLKIPYAAITRFADPGVKFGLQFTPAGEGPAQNVGRSGLPAVQPAPAAAEAKAPAEPEPPRDEAAENIVRLDTFRKK
ncbi:MAG: SspB family protein [Alphaproteobacteria bacterium]